LLVTSYAWLALCPYEVTACVSIADNLKRWSSDGIFHVVGCAVGLHRGFCLAMATVSVFEKVDAVY